MPSSESAGASTQNRRRGVWLVSLVASAGMICFTTALLILLPKGSGAVELMAFFRAWKAGHSASGYAFLHPKLQKSLSAADFEQQMAKVASHLGALKDFRATGVEYDAIGPWDVWTRVSGRASFAQIGQAKVVVTLRPNLGAWRVTRLDIDTRSFQYTQDDQGVIWNEKKI
jgi:hypothetical protein